MHFRKLQTQNDFKNLKAEKCQITVTEHSTFQKFVKLVKYHCIMFAFRIKSCPLLITAMPERRINDKDWHT